MSGYRLEGNVLITGGSGTLGHAILRKAEAEHWPAMFTVFSRSEFLQAQMRREFPGARYVLGDVRDYDRLSAAIAGHSLVVHAAAMKRIPECESQPAECFKTNVQGSANVVRACVEHGIDRCIGISTDKACKAITTYGASKLLLESLFRAAPRTSCDFTLVRYGNVVASRGSVIPLWREQAAQGKPLTVTDARCTRFFMPPSAAVDLILQAAHIPHGQCIVAKMKSIGILDLAEAVVPGAGFVETGLRSCEKIHEDLVHPDEVAAECGGQFILHSDYGSLGHRYTSDKAERLSIDEFRAMLAEAEELERVP